MDTCHQVSKWNSVAQKSPGTHFLSHLPFEPLDVVIDIMRTHPGAEYTRSLCYAVCWCVCLFSKNCHPLNCWRLIEKQSLYPAQGTAPAGEVAVGRWPGDWRADCLHRWKFVIYGLGRTVSSVVFFSSPLWDVGSVVTSLRAYKKDGLMRFEGEMKCFVCPRWSPQLGKTAQLLGSEMLWLNTDFLPLHMQICLGHHSLASECRHSGKYFKGHHQGLQLFDVYKFQWSTKLLVKRTNKQAE